MCTDSLTAQSVITTLVFFLVIIGVGVLLKKKFGKKYKREIHGLKAVGKIMFVSYQIMVVLPNISPEMDLPENFTKSIEAMNFLKFDVFKMISFGCMTSGFDYHRRLLATTLLPLGVCGLLLVLGILAKKKKNTFFTIMLVLTYTVLPSASTMVFGAFPCDTLDTSKSYLIADYGIDCDVAAYKSYAVFSGLMVLVYPFGIPLLYTYLLVKKKGRIMKPTEEREEDEELVGMSFLFENYKPEFWYFEIIVTLMRLMLTGVLGLIKPGSITQLSVGMLMTLMGILLSGWLKPYDIMRDNVLSVMSYVQVSEQQAKRATSEARIGQDV